MEPSVGDLASPMAAALRALHASATARTDALRKLLGDAVAEQERFLKLYELAGVEPILTSSPSPTAAGLFNPKAPPSLDITKDSVSPLPSLNQPSSGRLGSGKLDPGRAQAQNPFGGGDRRVNIPVEFQRAGRSNTYMSLASAQSINTVNSNALGVNRRVRGGRKKTKRPQKLMLLRRGRTQTMDSIASLPDLDPTGMEGVFACTKDPDAEDEDYLFRGGSYHSAPGTVGGLSGSDRNLDDPVVPAPERHERTNRPSIGMIGRTSTVMPQPFDVPVGHASTNAETVPLSPSVKERRRTSMEKTMVQIPGMSNTISGLQGARSLTNSVIATISLVDPPCWMRAWCCVLAVALVVEVLVIPYVAAFVLDTLAWELPVRQALTVVFLADLVFFAWRVDWRPGLAGRYEAEYQLFNYMTSWGPLDILGSMPWDYLVGEQWRVLRLFRMLRARVVLPVLTDTYRRAYPQHVSTGYGLALASVPVCITIMMHVCACMLGTLARAASPEEPSWADLLLSRGAEKEDPGIRGIAPFACYRWGLYFAFTTLTTVGYGDLTPQNDAEVEGHMVLMGFSAIGFAQCLAVLTTIVSDAFVRLTGRSERARALERYFHWRGLPNVFRTTLVRFLQERSPELDARADLVLPAHPLSPHLAEYEEKLLAALSPLLRAELRSRVFGSLVTGAPFLFWLSPFPAAVRAAVDSAQFCVFSPGSLLLVARERITDIVVLTKGLVAIEDEVTEEEIDEPEDVQPLIQAQLAQVERNADEGVDAPQAWSFAIEVLQKLTEDAGADTELPFDTEDRAPVVEAPVVFGDAALWAETTATFSARAKDYAETVRIPVSAVLQLTRSDKRIEHRYRAFRGAILAIDGTGLEENPLEPFFGDDSPMMSPGL